MSGHVPHEFTSISVSTYEAASLSALLQERSADAWTVVSIVPAGTSVVAYLSRPVSGAATATASAASATPTSVAPEPAAASPASSTGAGWALQPDSASSSTTSSSTAASASAVPAASTPAATSAAAPAGWYADPSGRFELRYWDGDRWTEHVSRGGTQHTDPPVA